MDIHNKILYLPHELHWNIIKYLSHPNSIKLKTYEFAWKILSKKILYHYMHSEMNYFSPEKLTDNEECNIYISEVIFREEICKNLRQLVYNYYLLNQINILS